MKKQKSHNYNVPSLKSVHCTKCGSTMKISHDSVSGVCWRCVCNAIPIESTN